MVMLGGNGVKTGTGHLSKETKFKRLVTDIKRLDAVFAKTIKSKMLSPTGRLLLYVASCDGASVKDTMRASGLSNRAFFEIYGRLKEDAFIRIEVVPTDRRCKMITLGEAFYKMIDSE
jgi:DNA-binding MarR family transcriptional regulator